MPRYGLHEQSHAGLLSVPSLAPLPPVSVVVPLFNERYGVALLESRLLPFVASWRQRREVELVLVDDGSVDGTAEALAPLASADWVKLRRHETNRGLTAALRTG